jgi:hypothetical protein
MSAKIMVTFLSRTLKSDSPATDLMYERKLVRNNILGEGTDLAETLGLTVGRARRCVNML